MTLPVPIISQPGIQRDGTTFDTLAHFDGEWVRWQRGRPRKMGGYEQVFRNTAGEIERGFYAHPSGTQLYMHQGSQNYLEQWQLNTISGVSGGLINRTPAAFATSTYNMWQFDEMFDSVGGVVDYVIAHATPTAQDISSNTATAVYLGQPTLTTAFTAIASSSVSGGIVVLHPYLLAFGSNGLVLQSVAGDPSNFVGAGSNEAYVTGKKIVRGLASRGGAGNAPSGLLWSLDSLIRVSYVGGSAVFQYDHIATYVGLLSAACVIEYDGVYYWIGQARFLMFNGVMRELPNTMNKNYFFDNLNWTHRNKTFAFKVPHFGEIWWCFPKGASTEPNWAVVYNINENCWYDTELPSTGRTAAVNAATYRFPILADGTLDADNRTAVYRHESGVDEVSGAPATTKARRSYYETGRISAVSPGEGSKPVDKSLRVACVEPDFVQTGDMTVQVTGRANARGASVESDPQTFPATPTTPEEQLLWFQGEIRRELRFKFQSNVAGGDYQAGAPIAHIGPADGSRLGAIS